MIRKRVLAGFLAAVAVLLLGTVAFGYFSSTSASGGAGGSSAATVGAGAKPTTSQNVQSVTVSGPASVVHGYHTALLVVAAVSLATAMISLFLDGARNSSARPTTPPHR